jgi:Tat protein translocase TatB subunit
VLPRGGSVLGLGLGEIALIAIVILLVVGPEQLPQLMRTAGRTYGQVRRAADDLRRAFVLEADRQDADERYRKLQERRKEMEEARRQAKEALGSVHQAPDPEPERPPAAPEGGGS